jgi:hypothetical protein
VTNYTYKRQKGKLQMVYRYLEFRKLRSLQRAVVLQCPKVAVLLLENRSTGKKYTARRVREPTLPRWPNYSGRTGAGAVCVNGGQVNRAAKASITSPMVQPSTGSENG